MKTNNELIAKFIGAEQYGSESVGVFWRFNDMEDVLSEDLAYDTSWDSLMVAVQKIGKLYEKAFPTNEEFIKRIKMHEDPVDKEYIDVISISVCSPINEVYDATVKFILWYNSRGGGI
jgi:hypothetical protein